MKSIIPIFNIIMGLGIAGLWFKDFLGNRFEGKFFDWRDGDNIMWPRIVAEMLTATMLLLSGIGTLMQVGWAELLTFFALGAVFYASFDSLAWTFARKDRWAYSTLMLTGLIGSVVFITVIIVELI